jgi:hypothetical protein
LSTGDHLIGGEGIGEFLKSSAQLLPSGQCALRPMFTELNISPVKRACGKLRVNEYSTSGRTKKTGFLDSGLLFHEIVAGVRFQLTTLWILDGS